MRKFIVCSVLFVFLGGCSAEPDEIDTGLELRSKLLQSEECTFEATITADYGDKLHIFSLNCKSKSNGDLTFTVTEPVSISGISGILTGDGGELTFDDTALHFELVADDQLSPISAPWILLKTLRTGYVTSACRENGNIRLSIDDSFEKEPLRLDIWLNSENNPERADILYDGRRILSIAVTHFQIL